VACVWRTWTGAARLRYLTMTPIFGAGSFL
jgi:hypothetical protein